MRVYGLPVAVAAAAFLAGCRASPSAAEMELAVMQEEISELDRKLEGLDERLECAPGFPRDRAKGPDVAALEKIILPENATDEQIRRYIREIMEASAGQNSCSSIDPQIGMLRRIGPGHLEVVLPFWRSGGMNRSCLLRAFDTLVGEADKAVVKREIANYPVLAGPIREHGWEKEMEPELMDALEKARRLEPPLFGAYDKLAGKPENRKRMIECYCSRSDAFGLFPVIEAFPDADLPEITRRAWERFRKSHSGPVRFGYAYPAARYGSVEALGELIFQLQDRKSSAACYAFPGGGAAALVALTGQPADPETLLAWYEANRDRLVFDRERGRFSAGSAQ